MPEKPLDASFVELSPMTLVKWIDTSPDLQYIRESADGQPSLTPAKGEKRVGFDVAALMPALTIEAISLPYFSC